MEIEKAKKIINENSVSFINAGLEDSLPIKMIEIGTVWAKVRNNPEHLPVYGIQNEDGCIVSYLLSIGCHSYKFIEEFDDLREAMKALEIVYPTKEDN